MKYYLIIGSIILVLLIGSLFLFTGQPVEVETIDFTEEETELALKELKFEIKFPAYIPENVKMKDASISVIDGKHEMIAFSYTNTTNSFGFEFYASKNDVTLDDIARNDDYWEWNNTTIDSINALIGANESTKENSLVFREENILYRFYSEDMKLEELIKIAKSLK